MSPLKNGGPKLIAPSKISVNKENPRIIFDEESLGKLRESIRNVGILVPLTVYEDPDLGYVLLDGERRLRCARDLGLKEVPANIIAKPNPLENILRMFNIHIVRKQWSLVETAISVNKIAELIGDDRDKSLADLIGLTPSQIRSYKQVMTLPQNARQIMIDFERSRSAKGRPSLLIEMLPVLKIIERDYPKIWSHSDSGANLVESFVSKYNKDIITNVTHFRLLRKTLLSFKRGVDRNQVEYAFRNFLDTEMSLDDLFEDVARKAYALERVLKECEKLTSDLPALSIKELDKKELDQLRNAVEELDKRLRATRKMFGDL